MTYSPSYRRILHRMGYYDYQQGLVRRHLQQDQGWIGHEQKCREFIMKAIDLYKPDKVTVLGSGWLLDLPLAEMVEKVNEIVLSDIVHPPDVIRQTSGMKNVKLAEEDITGGLILEVWDKAGKRHFWNKLDSLVDIHIPDFDPPEDPGMIISLNILTQLETLPEKLLRRKSDVPENIITNFKREIQSKHLQLLQSHKSVLISDTAEIEYNQDGLTVEKDTLLVQLPKCRTKEEWIWDFDLRGDDYVRKKSKLRVTAMII